MPIFRRTVSVDKNTIQSYFILTDRPDNFLCPGQTFVTDPRLLPTPPPGVRRDQKKFHFPSGLAHWTGIVTTNFWVFYSFFFFLNYICLLLIRKLEMRGNPLTRPFSKITADGVTWRYLPRFIHYFYRKFDRSHLYQYCIYFIDKYNCVNSGNILCGMNHRTKSNLLHKSHVWRQWLLCIIASSRIVTEHIL